MEVKIYQLTGIGLISAVLCILGPWVIPIGMIPVNFTGIAVYLSLFLIGKKRTVTAVCVYLLLGCAGLPVFSGFGSGPGKLLGPTGGYLAGYIFSSFLAGTFLEQRKVIKAIKSEIGRSIYYFMALTVGNLVLYALGSIWLCHVNSFPLVRAFEIGVLPFILPDIMKNLLVISLGKSLKIRLSI